MLEQFLEKKVFPGKVIFAKVWGSRSHNTNKPDSDWDFSGVYVAPTKEFLGLDRPAETVQNKEGQEKPDYSFHEVGKFCNLLLTGNPGILEMLFTERLFHSTDDWQPLVENRHRFLSKSAVNHYVGYAEGQLKRLKSDSYLHTSGGKYNEKWAYHLMRLLIDADRIVSGGEPVVWKVGEEREFLMRIRCGEMTQEEVEREANSHIDKLRNTVSAIREKGDRVFLNDWLVALRMKNL
jgi:predicted nucleotidyltransferase